jgi:hypothetical protein
MGLGTKAIVAADGIVVDTNEKLTASMAQALYAAGVRVVIRYAPLPGNSAKDDLDAVELGALTDQGHTVLLIQHPREPKYNELTAATGLADAQHVIAYALSIGYDPKLPQPDGRPPRLGLDMEGLKNPGPDSFAHAKAWVVAALAAGFAVFVYLGYDCGLTSAQCDELAELGAYVDFLCDAGPYADRPAPKKGYVLKQHLQSTLAGVGVDRDDVLQNGVIYGVAKLPDPIAPDSGDPAADITQPMAIPSSLA